MQNNNSGMGFWGVVLAIIVAVLIMCVLGCASKPKATAILL